ncbi:hypothetical protein XA68_11585 [Ophiocordyceps unilateralis]|uniref:Uncharacterized protein n=1 Tax=Ophiocordyceps unilateralis TaxID=268505 RepID=A0A2A9PGG2_OPHUN|nr:hypothetical protein XA68_11585 [Ophiocordyceps unilateralis]
MYRVPPQYPVPRRLYSTLAAEDPSLWPEGLFSFFASSTSRPSHPRRSHASRLEHPASDVDFGSLLSLALSFFAPLPVRSALPVHRLPGVSCECLPRSDARLIFLLRSRTVCHRPPPDA